MLLHRAIAETPIAVLDFETTGLCAGPDRVIEVSVVRIDPGQKPRLVFDTLIHPQRDVAATWVHGITDEMVADAPTFEQIAPALLHHLAGAALATYNVYFDYPFLEFELRRAGYARAIPHLCLMYLRPLLQLGRRCGLEGACQCHNIALRNAHQTAGDTMAAAMLWLLCLEAAAQHGAVTFADLVALKRKPYRFCESFRHRVLPPAPCGPVRTKSRARGVLEAV